MEKNGKKQIKIDEELFWEIYDYFIAGKNTPTDEDAKKIKQSLLLKTEKMIDHYLFTKYKRTPSSLEREEARIKYLEWRRMPEEERTKIEEHL